MHVHVAIVGLDRRSASIGLALKRYQARPKAEHTFTIIGSDKHAHAMKTAQKIGDVDNFHRALLKATANADLIFLNGPYSDLEDVYTRLGPELKPGAVVIDLAQLKQPSVELAATHFPRNAAGVQVAYVVGVTPIVNVKALYSADLEVEGARADLFDETEFLVTPDSKCPSEAITLVEDIIRLLGGTTRFMDPQEHDGLLAATEQLPALLGSTLFYALMQSEGWMELRRMVNPSLALMIHHLRDRSPADSFALFDKNRSSLLHQLETFIGVLDQIRDVIANTDDPEQLDVFLSRVHREWEKWDVKRHSGKWEDAKAVEPLSGPLGTMAGMLNLNRRNTTENDNAD